MVDDQPSELDSLVARLGDGDRSVFTQVFQQLWQPLHRLSTAMLKNEADASDAAQQSLEKILIRASEYDPSRPALPWALAITAWECRTIRRKRQRRREVPDDAPDHGIGEDGEDELEQRDLERAALEALGALSDVDRETLIATFWEEAASVRGAALRKRRERALGRLRQMMKKLYGLD